MIPKRLQPNYQNVYRPCKIIVSYCRIDLPLVVIMESVDVLVYKSVAVLVYERVAFLDIEFMAVAVL